MAVMERREEGGGTERGRTRNATPAQHQTLSQQ
jgi:hypothetical protein